MKKILIFSLISLLIFICGCLTYEKITIRIVFDNPEKESSGKIYITTIGLATTEDSLAKRQADFEQVLGFLSGDDFLLDAMKSGIYIKNRNLVKENNKLVFKYDGIFNELIMDNDFEIKIINDERVAILDNEDIIVNTNGKIEKDSSYTYLKWSRNTKEIYWEYKMDDEEKAYSLLPFYEEWQESKN